MSLPQGYFTATCQKKILTNIQIRDVHDVHSTSWSWAVHNLHTCTEQPWFHPLWVFQDKPFKCCSPFKVLFLFSNYVSNYIRHYIYTQKMNWRTDYIIQLGQVQLPRLKEARESFCFESQSLSSPCSAVTPWGTSACDKIIYARSSESSQFGTRWMLLFTARTSIVQNHLLLAINYCHYLSRGKFFTMFSETISDQ